MWQIRYEELRAQQAREFKLIMGALAQTRDSVTEIKDAVKKLEQSVEKLETGLATTQDSLAKHQAANEERFELLLNAVGDPLEARLSAIETRLDRLENPAA